jgi:RNA polymerase sigma-70 factor (ECF subfamily)
MSFLPLRSAATGAGNFQTTRWSVVLAAGGGPETPEAHEAIALLCQTYWYPLYVFVRGTGRAAPDAEDLVQSFFAALLAGGVIAKADMARGRFRSFLLGRLNHFLIDDWRRAHREKRGGDGVPLSLDDPTVELRVQRELAHEQTPARLFDRAWAMTLLDRAVARVGAECDGGKDAGRFAVLKNFLAGGRGDTRLAEAAEALGLSIPAVKSVVHRLRERFREVVREEIAETVERPDQIDDELRWLLATITGR